MRRDLSHPRDESVPRDLLFPNSHILSLWADNDGVQVGHDLYPCSTGQTGMSIRTYLTQRWTTRTCTGRQEYPLGIGHSGVGTLGSCNRREEELPALCIQLEAPDESREIIEHHPQQMKIR